MFMLKILDCQPALQGRTSSFFALIFPSRTSKKFGIHLIADVPFHQSFLVLEKSKSSKILVVCRNSSPI